MLNKVIFAVVVTAVGFATLASPTRARAGTIYLNPTTFFTDVSSLNLLFYDDFDSYATGGVSSPFSIGGGSASVSNAVSIATGGDGLGPDTSPDDKLLSQGLVASPLSFSLPGVEAFGFYFLPRNEGQVWTFGADVTGAFTAGGSVHFVGWIGAPNESLTSASYSDVGILVDDVYAYTAVPEPTTLMLLGTALAAIGTRRYGQRRK